METSLLKTYYGIFPSIINQPALTLYHPLSKSSRTPWCSRNWTRLKSAYGTPQQSRPVDGRGKQKRRRTNAWGSWSWRSFARSMLLLASCSLRFGASFLGHSAIQLWKIAYSVCILLYLKTSHVRPSSVHLNLGRFSWSEVSHTPILQCHKAPAGHIRQAELALRNAAGIVMARGSKQHPALLFEIFRMYS